MVQHQTENSIDVVRPSKSWAGVDLFCTTRAGGVSIPPFDSFNLGLGAGDDPVAVHTNRDRLMTLVPAKPYWLKQVHGDVVHQVDLVPSVADWQTPEGDASVTTQPGRVLAILTADCLPIVLADDLGKVLGVAHAGWRGLALGVLDRTVEAMRLLQPDCKSLKAWIGPAISQTAFQVGQDVYDAFVLPDPDAKMSFAIDQREPGKWLADLPGLAQRRLESMGIMDIENAALCSFLDAEARFFSYRRDKIAGRMATLAWLTRG